MGFKINLTAPIFPLKANLDERSRQIVGEKNNPFIGIAPFATYKGKMYPLDLMKEVILKLSKAYTIFLFGGGHEEIVALNEIEATQTNVVNLAGKLSLDQEMDVISNLDLMVSMDSSNAHIAAMLGVKVVTLWGVTHPYAGFYPFNQNNNNALLADRLRFPKIPTSIYGNKYPEGYETAMTTITPASVLMKIEKII